MFPWTWRTHNTCHQMNLGSRTMMKNMSLDILEALPPHVLCLVLCPQISIWHFPLKWNQFLPNVILYHLFPLRPNTPNASAYYQTRKHNTNKWSWTTCSTLGQVAAKEVVAMTTKEVININDKKIPQWNPSLPSSSFPIK